jgi:hypothetical protein
MAEVMQPIKPQDIVVGDLLLIPTIDPVYPQRVEQIIAPHSDAGPYVRVSSGRPGRPKQREVIVPWHAVVVRLTTADSVTAEDSDEASDAVAS